MLRVQASLKQWTNRVLVVNHGYPPQFNAGSEIYTQNLALSLKRRSTDSKVAVFSRSKNMFAPDFTLSKQQDSINPDIPLYLVNHAREAPYRRFLNEEIKSVFEHVLNTTSPEIVHFNHFNHMSLDMAQAARSSGANTVMTLHDFWLMCPRGQFLVSGVTAADGEPWEACDAQVNTKCAERCYSNRFSTGIDSTDSAEQLYWTTWIGDRMNQVRKTCEDIDVFIAPSKYLQHRFVEEFGLPASKVMYIPYGFDRKRLEGRVRTSNNSKDAIADPLVLGYIGRHQPSKGIHLLIEAVNRLKHIQDEFKLIIFGRPDEATASLKAMVEVDNIEWRSEYTNMDIVPDVFNQVDAIVVPSIWSENSPLVIHEAQQCRVPVITSNEGGMGELVKDGINGLTFIHRDVKSLSEVIANAVQSPDHLSQLGQRGYLHSEDGQVPCIDEHADVLSQVYKGLRLPQSTDPAPLEIYHAPWRITFDTNPDDCNFSCTMCEQHSPYSPHQIARKRNNTRRRRMDFETLEQVVAECAPQGLQEIIPSTMGEPLQYVHKSSTGERKTFEDIIQLCYTYGVKLNLTTNGSFWRLGPVAWARLICPVGSDVKISWNGASQEVQESIMRGSDYKKQLENLKAFVAVRDELDSSGGNRCSITLQLTFMEVNLAEIPDVVRLGIANNVDRIKGHQLWSHFDEIKDEDLRRSPEAMERWNDIVALCHDIAESNRLPSGKKIRLDNFTRLDWNTDSESGGGVETVCPFLGKEAWVNHKGRMDPCCAPDEQRLTLGSFGNIHDSTTTHGSDGSTSLPSLLNVWRSRDYTDFVKDYTSNPLCKKCTMRRPA